MTLAGLMTPRDGRVTLGGRPLHSFSELELRSSVCFFAEDAHLFDTTIRDNLLVAQGDCADDEVLHALGQVGLQPWLAGMPAGLDTVLTGGAQSVSAGQRRRLLLARALISRARIVLLDEPTEHLDAADATALLEAMLDPESGLFDASQTIVVATHHVHDAGSAIDVRALVHSAGRTVDARRDLPRAARSRTPLSIPRASASTSGALS
jgi:ATP-binding cassette subfamily C protein CydC